MKKLFLTLILNCIVHIVIGQLDTANMAQKAADANIDGANMYNDGKKIEALTKYKESFSLYENLVLIDADRYEERFNYLKNKILKYYSKRYQYDEIITFLNQTTKSHLDIVKKYPQKEDYLYQLREHYFTLGHFCMVQEKYKEAETALLESLKIANDLKKTSSNNQQAITSIKYNLAMTYNNSGAWEKAVPYYEDLLASYSDSLKVNKKEYGAIVASIKNDFGLTLWHLKKYSKAEKFFKESIEFRKQDTTEEDNSDNEYEIAICLNNLGNVYDDSNELDKAEKTYLEALKIKKKLAEENPMSYNHSIMMTYYNMGMFYRNRMEKEKTLSYKDKGIEMATEAEKYRKLSPQTAAFIRSHEKKIQDLKNFFDTVTLEQLKSKKSKE